MFPTLAHLIHVFDKVVASLRSSGNLVRRHGRVLLKILDVFPLEVFAAFLRVWFPSEMAVSGSLLILGLTEGETHSNSTGTTVKFDLQNIGDVICIQRATLGSVGFDEEG